MRLVLQRVSEASVQINGSSHAGIGKGLMILLGIEERDTQQDADWLIGKVRQMRIFNDEAGKMNLSIEDIGGEFLVVSQFTLHALTAKGNRPSFIKAARPEQAIPLYNYFLSQLSQVSKLAVKSGVFGADMQVHILNDGPVTIWIDSWDRN
ncbi:MAG: D-tyrosyl-tRNA(Tyr) deacylase [Bacteroidetes bacterium]|nr:D-tyrosyl-tRNA(Tyr) deacylase [Bacteroidota bacterium]